MLSLKYSALFRSLQNIGRPGRRMQATRVTKQFQNDQFCQDGLWKSCQSGSFLSQAATVLQTVKNENALPFDFKVNSGKTRQSENSTNMKTLWTLNTPLSWQKTVLSGLPISKLAYIIHCLLSKRKKGGCYETCRDVSHTA